VAALDGPLVSGTQLVDLGAEPLPLPEFAGAPVVPNAADQAYAAVLLDDLSWQATVDDLGILPDPLLRAVTWSNALTRLRSGLIPVPSFVTLVAEHLGSETDPLVFDSMLGRISRQVLAWTAPEELADLDHAVASVCADALAAGDPGRGLSAMRRLASTTVDAGLLRAWLSDGEARPGLEVDRDTRWIVVRRLVTLGEAGEELIEAEVAADHSQYGHEAALTTRASRPDASAKAEAWARAVDPHVSNRDFEALVAGLWTPGQEDLTAPYVSRYLEQAPTIAERGQAFAKDVAFAAPRFPMALSALQSYRDDLAVAADKQENTVLRRGWHDLVDDLDVTLRVRRAG
jgi:aminopeptidase N